MSGLMQDPLLSTEQSQVTVHDPDTQEVSPKETARLVDWIKATVKSVYPDKRDFPTPRINARWNTPDEAAETLRMQAMWDWLYDDWDISPTEYAHYPDYGKCWD